MSRFFLKTNAVRRLVILPVGLICLLFTAAFASNPPFEPILVDSIPDALIEPGSGGVKEIIVVEKSTQKLFLFEFKMGRYYLVREYDCTTGENLGDKLEEGDKKTPEGFYLFNKKSLKHELADIYGVLAYPMDYPNFWDLRLGKGGKGIWLHGTNRKRVPRDTNGCIALENIDLITLENRIRLYDTPIVVYDKIRYAGLEEINRQAARIKAFVEKWRYSWENKDFSVYKSCYARDFTNSDDRDYDAWMEHKERLNEKYDRISVDLKNLRIFKHKDMFLVLFDQYYRGNDKFKSDGRKRLFLEPDGDSFKIKAEVWRPFPKVPKPRFLSAKVKDQVRKEAEKELLKVASADRNPKPEPNLDSPPVESRTVAAENLKKEGKAVPDEAFPAAATGPDETRPLTAAVGNPKPVPAPENEPEPTPPPAPEKNPKASIASPPKPPARPVPNPEFLAARNDNQENPGRTPLGVGAEDNPRPGAKLAAAKPASAPGTLKPPKPKSLTDDLDYADVRATIENWLDAWREQDIDRYVDHYHPDFRYKDMDLAGFRDYKKDLAKKYNKITIIVDKMKIRVNGSRALVTFMQDYRSDKYQDYGRKTLILYKQAAGWQIKKETWQDMSGGAKP